MRRKRRYISVCAERGCPELSDERFCSRHAAEFDRQKDKRRESAQERGYDSEWSKTRAEFLRAYPICQDQEGCVSRATDVDHIDGKGPNGKRGHDWTNLRALCHSHHSKRTARDQPGGFSRGTRATQSFVILAGRSGTGKTTIGKPLASKLNAAFSGPDDFDEGWTGLYDLLDYTDKAIVECVKIPYGLRRKMKERGAIVIDLTASAEVRQARLMKRGEPDENINWLLRPRGSLGYEEFIEPDLKVQTDRPTAEVVAELEAEIRSRLNW